MIVNCHFLALCVAFVFIGCCSIPAPVQAEPKRSDYPRILLPFVRGGGGNGYDANGGRRREELAMLLRQIGIDPSTAFMGTDLISIVLRRMMSATSSPLDLLTICLVESMAPFLANKHDVEARLDVYNEHKNDLIYGMMGLSHLTGIYPPPITDLHGAIDLMTRYVSDILSSSYMNSDPENLESFRRMILANFLWKGIVKSVFVGSNAEQPLSFDEIMNDPVKWSMGVNQFASKAPANFETFFF